MKERGVSSLLISFFVFLGVFIALAVFILAYYGFFNIEGSVKGTASLEKPFSITNWAAKTSLSNSGGIILEIKNIGFEPYNILSVEVSNCNYENNNGEGWNIGEREKVSIIVKCRQNNTLKKGELIRKDIVVYYRFSQGTIIQKTKGFIKTQVIE